MIRYFQNNEDAALKAKEIVDNSFKLDKKNAQFVSPAKFDKTNTGFKITTITKIPGQKARTQQVRVDMEDGFEGSFNKANVKVDCSCARYLYVWNYALNQYDAAIKDRTNGEAPEQTNPAETPGICKHGVVALKLLSRMNPYWQKTAPTSSSGKKAIPLTTLDKILKRVRKNKV